MAAKKNTKTKTINLSRSMRLRIVAGISTVAFLIVTIMAANNLPSADLGRELAGVYGSEETEENINGISDWGSVPIGNNDTNLDTTITYYDVGQADATLIQLPNKKLALIDTGDGSNQSDIIGKLQEENIVVIDYLILTHPHADHIGGAESILDNFEVENIYMPRIANNLTPTTKTYEQLLLKIKEQDKKVIAPEQGHVIDEQPGTSLRVVSVKSPEWSNLNDYSICLQLDIGITSFLFMGDAEEDAVKAIMETTDIAGDVLKVGHHGSDTSSPDAFIEQIKPKISIISCGEGNDYGHPHKKTLEVLEKYDSSIYRTDYDGTIIIKTNGQTTDIVTSNTKAGEPAA